MSKASEWCAEVAAASEAARQAETRLKRAADDADEKRPRFVRRTAEQNFVAEVSWLGMGMARTPPVLYAEGSLSAAAAPEFIAWLRDTFEESANG